MKTIALLRRLPDLSRQAFRDYYESKHVPLAVRYVHFTKYARSHLIAPSEVPYDVLSEFWLADPSVVTSLATSPAGDLLRQDAARFVAETRFRATAEESLLAGPPRGIEVGRVKKYAVMLRRQAYASAADFVADAIACRV